MSRIPLVRIEDMTDAQRQQYLRFPSNLTRALLLADDRLAAVPPASANALRASALDTKVREAIILRVARLNGSAYERMQHIDQALKAGFTNAEIASLEAGETSFKSETLNAALTFTDEAVALVKVTRETFGRAAVIFSPREITTMLLLIGHYMTIARLLETLEVDLDAEPDSFSSEH